MEWLVKDYSLDAVEKIQNCHLSIFTGGLTRMDDILYAILITRNKVKKTFSEIIQCVQIEAGPCT
jgi:hypothetical protein